MSRMFTPMRLRQENQAFAGTAGISCNNCDHGFQAAFQDTATGRVEPARFEDGTLAPMHILSGVPEEWVVQRDAQGHPAALLDSIISGFIRDSVFYTRDEAAALV